MKIRCCTGFFSMDLCFEKIRAAIHDGHLRLTDVVDYFLKRIQSHAHLNAFVEVYTHEALHKAKRLQEQWENDGEMGPLTGLIVSVKDLIAHKDHRLTAASAILQGYISPFSATIVRRLEEAGAIVIGRTNCDEFGMGSTGENSFYGPAFNALNPQLVAGGSSSGAATSVAANFCHLALGTDTGGSVRQPAAFQGIFGYKPTYGRLSRWGVIAYASSMDQIGLCAHSPKLLTTVMQLLSSPDEQDLHTLRWPAFNSKMPKRNDSKLAMDVRLFSPPYVSDKHAGLWKKVLATQLFKHAKPIELPGMEEALALFHILAPAEAASNLNRYDGVRYGQTSLIGDFQELVKRNRTQGFGSEVKRRILAGNYFLSESETPTAYEQAHSRRLELMYLYNKIFLQTDYLLLPTTYSDAFPPKSKSNNPVDTFEEDKLLVLANLIGCPAVTVPLQQADQIMPIGLQILSAPGNDEALLDFAGEAEELFLTS